MRRTIATRGMGVAALLAVLIPAATVGSQRAPSAHAAGTQVMVPLQRLGQSSPSGGALGAPTDAVANETDDTQDNDSDGSGFAGVNRTVTAVAPSAGPSVSETKKAKSNPELGTNFEGLNFNQQRFANGGNQFSVEPPDQALCAGNGYVLESVNDVLRVFSTSGTPLASPVDLNTFYGYPAAVTRSGPNAGQRGPSITDPVCYYDPETQRFFHVVLTLDRKTLTNPALAGTNHLDIAVSDTSNPLGTWTIYKLPVQNNGTEGTPDHGCSLGFCLGDYPHIGADANGIYLTTNEFSLFGPGFYGVNIYALSKQALAAGTLTSVTLLSSSPTGRLLAGIPGFTVWPATTPGGAYQSANGGTEYFMSSLAVFSNDGTANQIVVFSLTNTGSLNSASPSLGLTGNVLNTETYSVPPRSNQKAGDQPLSQCLADTVTNCWALKAGASSPKNATFGALNSNDSRIQQVTFANGKLWGALDTGVSVGGATKAGIAYFIVNPDSNKLVFQGYLALANNNLTYPAIGVTPSGRGVIAFTLVGADYYPSAGYAGLDALAGAGDIHVAMNGVGPQDGFTQYKIFGSGRPRWGDYGATAVDGNSIWIASEDVAQTCNYATYLSDTTCGGTRAALGNWSTHISSITP